MKFYSFAIGLIFILAFGLVTRAQNTNEFDSVWQPTPGTTWQWQLSGNIDTQYDVDMYDIDLFDAPQVTIDTLKARGVIVICYFSAGSYEEWRPDAARFPAHIIGKKLDGWAGERWLNIAEIDALSDVMLGRFDLAVERGCDGVEPDNVDGYTNKTGFPLNADDQFRYGVWLAEQAHMRGLSIGLKNNLDQVKMLLPFYDWALNEQCFQYKECDSLLPFIDAGKAVFGVEYELKPKKYCEAANQFGFSWLAKSYDLANEAPNACTGDTPTIITPTEAPPATDQPTPLPTTIPPTEEPPSEATAIPPTDEPEVTPTEEIPAEPTEDPDEYNKKGYDDEGYDAEGYNKKGYDRDGYDRDGYNKKGYDRDGYDRDGYDSEGYDQEGYDRDGYDSEGYDDEGYDKKGYDDEGYDRDGYDKKGYDRDGLDEDGCTKDSCD